GQGAGPVDQQGEEGGLGRSAPSRGQGAQVQGPWQELVLAPSPAQAGQECYRSEEGGSHRKNRQGQEGASQEENGQRGRACHSTGSLQWQETEDG
ncbi:hypothetical protein BG000_006684, partial [Podila horticola]